MTMGNEDDRIEGEADGLAGRQIYNVTELREGIRQPAKAKLFPKTESVGNKNQANH